MELSNLINGMGVGLHLEGPVSELVALRGSLRSVVRSEWAKPEMLAASDALRSIARKLVAKQYKEAAKAIVGPYKAAGAALVSAYRTAWGTPVPA